MLTSEHYSMLTVGTDYGRSGEDPAHRKEVQTAIRVGEFLGAPLLRVFAGSAAKNRPR